MPTRRSSIRRLPNRWTKRTADRLLAEWKAGGGSLAQFARNRGLKAGRLRWWRKQLAAKDQTRRTRVYTTRSAPMTFVPAIATTTPRAPVAERVIVRLPGGIEIEATSVDLLPPTWLASVARAVVSGA